MYVYIVDKSSTESSAKIFNVRDFVGDACKALASRVRGAVASETFDNFHKHSAQIIRQSVFGKGQVPQHLKGNDQIWIVKVVFGRTKELVIAICFRRTIYA
jgi:hypothetical protein